jgi:hypothetical protein
MASDDTDIRQHISELIATEHGLRERLSAGEITKDEEHAQLRAAEVELDQLWDLLRQRAAKREFGNDAGDAGTRGEGTVENYLG